ncbi:MAG: toll/interleukin-1 receptor domain-containing protein [Pirellulales bacterium]
MANIFLSHSSKDNHLAVRVKQWLANRGIGAVFLDIDPVMGLKGGREWERELYLQIRASDVFISIVTDHYLTSPWCLIEVAQAKALNKSIIPIVDAPPADGGTRRPLVEPLGWNAFPLAWT